MRKHIFAAMIGFMLVTFPAYAEPVQALLDAGNVSAAIAQLDADVSSSSPEVVAAALSARAQIALAQNDLTLAETLATQLATKLEDRDFVGGLNDKKASAWLVIAPWLSATIHRAQNNLDAARSDSARAEDALDRAKISDDWRGAVEMLRAELIRDDEKHARKAAEKAMDAFKVAGNDHNLAHAEVLLGVLELGRGKDRRARQDFESALRKLRSGEPTRCLVESQMAMVEAYLKVNSLDAAHEHLDALHQDLAKLSGADDLVTREKELYDELARLGAPVAAPTAEAPVAASAAAAPAAAAPVAAPVVNSPVAAPVVAKPAESENLPVAAPVAAEVPDVVPDQKAALDEDGARPSEADLAAPSADSAEPVPETATPDSEPGIGDALNVVPEGT